MKDALIKFCESHGGDVRFDPPLELEGWSNYKLIGLYLDDDSELKIVSEETFFEIIHILDQYWNAIRYEYRDAVCSALNHKRDKNLF